MSTSPVRPGVKPEVDPETERIIRERLSTFEHDKQAAKPWAEVKARILEQLKPS